MSDQRVGTNYYEVLEVAADATQAEIHKAYQRAKATYSQDNPALYGMFSQDEARELMRLIEEAYAVLGNQALRKTYDGTLLGKSASNVAAHVNAPIPGAVARSVESQHKALPDLGSPAATSSAAASPTNPPASSASTPAVVSEGRLPDGSEFVVRKRESPKPNLPPGMGRTPFSTYKIDDTFEAEIAAATEFDGALLLKIRTYKNLNLEKMSEATRISRTYLSAVESSDFKNLPAAVFVRGFVVQMARVLGLEEQKVASAYMKHFKAGGGK